MRTYSFVCFAKLGFGLFAVYFFAISLLYQRRIVSGVKNSHFLRRLQDNFLPFFANIARSESEYFMRLPSDSNFDFKIRLATSKYSIICDFSFDIQLASVVKNSILS